MNGEEERIGPMTGSVFKKLKSVIKNCRKRRKSPYICKTNPIVVKRNQPITIKMKPLKNIILP